MYTKLRYMKIILYIFIKVNRQFDWGGRLLKCNEMPCKGKISSNKKKLLYILKLINFNVNTI